jgi:hypothetical protein
LNAATQEIEKTIFYAKTSEEEQDNNVEKLITKAWKPLLREQNMI